MNDRERYARTMRYQPVDHPPLHLVEPWPDTLERWHREGLPRDRKVNDYLGVTPLKTIYIGCNTGLFPPFETRVIEDRPDCIISVDECGRIVRTFKHQTSMPEWIDFPVKCPADLRQIMDDHYQISPVEKRFPDRWEQKVHAAVRSGGVMIVDGGCAYNTLRNLAGVEYSSYLFYDAPRLVHEFFERYFTVVNEGIRRVSQWTTYFVIGFGEDIAYKNGPLISPAMFHDFLYPLHRQSMNLAHAKGIDLTWYDSDGDIRLLIPQYIELGINTFAPCEVAANMSPPELRRQFGREVRMIGGIDKREIARGRTAIDAELKRIQPVIAEGGYLPAIDHSISADISFNNYRYFIERIQEEL